MSASSANTALIPHPSVAYTSANATGASYTPADQSGTAVITVTVTDAGLDGDLNTSGGQRTTSRTFTVMVSAVNHAPTLEAISSRAAINEDAGTQTLTLSGLEPARRKPERA